MKLKHFFWGAGRIEREIEQAIERAHVKASRTITDAITAQDRIESLKRDIAQLEIDRDKKKETFDRREREVEHKIGLERKRQEFEIEQARRETTVKVREENLSADKERFKTEMDFQRKRLEGEVESLRSMIETLMERLPSTEIIANLGRK